MTERERRGRERNSLEMLRSSAQHLGILFTVLACALSTLYPHTCNASGQVGSTALYRCCGPRSGLPRRHQHCAVRCAGSPRGVSIRKSDHKSE